MNITTSTSYAALIGHPIAHSLSPTLHNTIYNKMDTDMVYMAFDVAGGNLERAIESLRCLGFKGFNVTIPYKEMVIPILDKIDPMATAIKAVNTVKIHNGKLLGYNTDGLGFLSSLKMNNVNCRDQSIAILGAGGSARAIGISLTEENPKEILILNRNKSRGESLVKDINSFAGTYMASSVERVPKGINIIINTTPLGMWPKVHSNPLNDYIFNPNTVVCDIVYNPRITTLLREANKANCLTVQGIGMLVGQGIKAHEIWTGQSIDQSMYNTLCDHLIKQLIT